MQIEEERTKIKVTMICNTQIIFEVLITFLITYIDTK
jgi:hypothetical protein